jgi:hypothetical protein
METSFFKNNFFSKDDGIYPDDDGQLPNMIYEDSDYTYEKNQNNHLYSNEFTPWDVDDTINDMNYVNVGETTCEYRMDETDGNYYSKQEFLDFYKNDYMWEQMNPVLVIKRKLLTDLYLWTSENISTGLRNQFIEDYMKTYS